MAPEDAGLVVATGMAAFGALSLSLLSRGDELIIHKTLYVTRSRWLRKRCPASGSRSSRSTCPHIPDLQLGAELMRLISEQGPILPPMDQGEDGICRPNGYA